MATESHSTRHRPPDFFKLAPGSYMDAAGRLRTSRAISVFASKQTAGHKQPQLWDDVELAGGAGTSSTYSTTRASTTLGVSNATAGTRVRQTFQGINYKPGRSTRDEVTFVLRPGGLGTLGICRRIGRFDDNNGIFLQDLDGELSFVIRSSASGAPVDTVYPRSEWRDPLDGTGPSRITLAPENIAIFSYYFRWLGAGPVWFGFEIDAEFILAHLVNHTNLISSVFISTPIVPMRAEITNNGTGPACSFEIVCCDCSLEAAADGVGQTHYLSMTQNSATDPVDANVVGTAYALLGVRLGTHRVSVDLIGVSVAAATPDAFEWFIVMNPDPITGISAWAPHDEGQIQVSYGSLANPSTSVVAGGTLLAGGLVSNQTRSADLRASQLSVRRLGHSIGGDADQMWLCARPLNAGLDVWGSLTLLEP